MKHKTNTQTMLTQNSETPSSNRRDQFSSDLCEALIASDIPLQKLENHTFRNFLEKYTKKSIPHESTLRLNYVDPLYHQKIKEIQEELRGKPIWLSVDETTDYHGRYVCNVIVGCLEVDAFHKPFLLDVSELMKTDHGTIAASVTDALQILWPEGLQYSLLRVIITDAAPYMIKAIRGLQVLFPRMIHITCLTHGLHRVAEFVRGKYSTFNRFISEMKKVLVKSSFRQQLFTELVGTSLPPEVVVTRWGTWLEACYYFAENLPKLQQFFEILTADSVAIQNCKCLLEEHYSEIHRDLVFISSNYLILSHGIKTLETSGLQLVESVDLVKKIQKTFGENPLVTDVKEKLQAVLEKNPGWPIISNIAAELKGELFPHRLCEIYSPEDILHMKNVPVVSVDVERSFSRYKAFLRQNRPFKMCTIKKQMIIMCNTK